MNSNERWKIDGDCRLCKRKHRCKTQCTKNKRTAVSVSRNGVVKKLLPSGMNRW